MVTKRRQRLRDRNQPTGLLQARLADALDKIAVLSEENDQLKAELTDMRKVPNPARDIAAEANKLLAAKDAEIDRLTAEIAKRNEWSRIQAGLPPAKAAERREEP